MAKTARNIFLLALIASAVWVAGLALTFSSNESPAAAGPTQSAAAAPDEGQNSAESEKQTEASGSLALVSAVATSVASLIGFVTTTAITWRKEKRESDLAELERRKLELELEKSKLELQELKKRK